MVMAEIRNIDTQRIHPDLSAPRRVNPLDEKLSEEERRQLLRRKRARAAAKKKNTRSEKSDDSGSESDVDIRV